MQSPTTERVILRGSHLVHSCAVVTEGQHHTERQEHPSSVQSHRPELHVGIAVLLDRKTPPPTEPDKILEHVPCNHACNTVIRNRIATRTATGLIDRMTAQPDTA